MSGEPSNSSGENRLPRRRILRGKDAFASLFQQGHRLAGRHVDLRYRILSSPTADVQAGFVAGRRLGNAVCRNYGKRIMREVYRNHQHLLDPVVAKVSVRLHVIFILKNPSASYADLLPEMPLLLQRLATHLTEKVK